MRPRPTSPRSHRVLAVVLAMTTSVVIAPAGFAAGGVLTALFGGAAGDGCGAACGCHDEAHAADEHGHRDASGPAHAADEHDHAPGGCPDGCSADADDDHGPCPEGCDGCACSATVGVARLTDPPPMIHRPGVSTPVEGRSATGHAGVLARIFKPPKRPQA